MPEFGQSVKTEPVSSDDNHFASIEPEDDHEGTQCFIREVDIDWWILQLLQAANQSVV